LNCNVDIIILGETKLKKSFAHGIYNLLGYKKYVCCRNSSNSGGGLIVYVKKGILVLNVDQQSAGFERLSIIFKVSSKSYKLVAYYRPPQQENMKSFLADIENEINDNVMFLIML